jgi:hypothetical protein
MRPIGAPKAAYGEIMNIVSDALLHSAFLTSIFLNCSLSLNHLAQHFLMHPLFLSIDQIASPDGWQHPLVIHHAKEMVQSLLKSALMEDGNNLVFLDATNPPLAPLLWLL